MKIITLFKFLITSLILGATWFFSSCGTPPVAAPAPPSPQTDSAGSATPWQPPVAPAAAAPLETHRRVAQQSKSRPGLGTGWGNEIDSSIGYTSFTRSRSKPAATDTIFYNDKEGIKAMTAGRWKYSGSGMQKAADGLVEWGVKGSWGTLKNYNTGKRRYVIGRKNASYSLVVKNLCHSRLEIVLSVDGLDVMDGKPASFKKRGYIIQPGKTLTVKGFRTSRSAVAAFKFSTVNHSYSNLRHGQTRNVGVIGIAVFTQKNVDPWKWSRQAVDQRHNATPFAQPPLYRAR